MDKIDKIEFLCLSCPDIRAEFATLDDLDNKRPYCDTCLNFMIPNLNSIRDLPDAVMSDVWITPDLAISWMDHTFPTFKSEMNEESIARYTDLMRTDQWENATEVKGGYWSPIVRIQHNLMLGYNRLQACINANKAFTNTTIEVNCG